MGLASVVLNNRFRVLNYEEGAYSCRVVLPLEVEKIHRDRLEGFLKLQLISAHTSDRDIRWNFKDYLIKENKEDCVNFRIVLEQDQVKICSKAYEESYLVSHAKTVLDSFLAFAENPKNYYEVSPLDWRKSRK